ncbi:AAA family ATPase [Chryseobacterium sp. POL2]|uniref:AAA family ATPase n=1 Tax=Chryseobacterium sp. POL2 TaxID=2713414 RepID=UPI001E3B5686|nr:AAA family ATPase [Chryseobacterium sp. POL2]
MQLRQSERKQARIKMALQGSAGSGKTYSSLILAKGMTNGDFSKVAIIDTENGSADLYAHLGTYNVLSLKPLFTPQQYVDAINICEEAGMEVIILDSISHCWDYLLDYHSSLAGNSFTNWAKIKPLEKLFIDKILQCKAHVIATMRTKQDYVLNQKDGKFVPEKVGLKSVQRDGLDYEFTLVFDIDIKHFAAASKDRTGLFMGKPEFKITEKIGEEILKWCNSGTISDKSTPLTNPNYFRSEKASKIPRIEPMEVFNTVKQESYIPNQNLGNTSEEEVYDAMQKCCSVQELYALYKAFPQFQGSLRLDFEAKKSLLINQNNLSRNGNNRIQ